LRHKAKFARRCWTCVLSGPSVMVSRARARLHQLAGRGVRRNSFSFGGEAVNKGQLVEALEGRLGGKKAAADALDAIIDTITRAVARGEKVGITGFGTFEKAARAARTGRNPRTGQAVKIKKTSVPRFKAGTAFKVVVADPRQLPSDTSATARKPAATAAAAKKTTAKKVTAKVGAKKAAAKKTAKKATAKKTVAKRAPAKKATAKKTVAKKAPAKKAATRKVAKKAPAKRTAAKKAPAKRTVAKKAPAKRAAAKKAPAKKAPAKRAAAKKAPARKTAAKKTARGRAR
jgi:DNA-binding protein HU-beta